MIILLVSYDENAFLDYAKQVTKYKYPKRYAKYGWVMRATFGHVILGARGVKCTWRILYKA